MKILIINMPDTNEFNYSECEILYFFELYDELGDGQIAMNQVGEVVRALGENPSNLLLSKLLEGFQEKDRINFKMFLPILDSVRKSAELYQAEDHLSVFGSFDRDNSKAIHNIQLRHLLTTYGEKLEDSEVDEILHNLEDSDGLVNYEELVAKISPSAKSKIPKG